MKAFRTLLRQASQWMESKPRVAEPASAVSLAPEEALGQLLQQGDWQSFPQMARHCLFWTPRL